MLDNTLKPNLENIHLLAVPIMHFGVHEVEPREIMRGRDWNRLKKAAQERADHHCEICGRYVSHSKADHDWINAHKAYEIDKENHLYKLVGVYGICRQCHDFIHLGRLNALLQAGHATNEYYDDVIDRAEHLLSLVNMTKERNTDIDTVYCLEYEGQKFVNDYFPEEAKRLHDEEGVNILHNSRSAGYLPVEYYFVKPEGNKKKAK